MNLNRIPKELKDLRQWVYTENDSKVPMCIETMRPASSVDPHTWGNYNRAKIFHAYYPYYWLGFVFNDNGIVGIDIDDGYDEDGFISELAADIIGNCHSYTEKSKSGRGFHILLKGDIPFKGKNNLKGVEIYKQSRFFIMTGDVLMYDTIIENQGAIDYILEKYFPTTKENNTSHNSFDRIYTPIWEKPQGRIQLRPVYPKINTGSRNICLTSLAGILHNQGYSPQQILDELNYCNKVACDPMLYERELITIVNSVTRYKR